MQRLLEAEQIPHKVKPVSDYRNLGDIYVEQIASSTDVRQAPTPPPPPPPWPLARFEGGWRGWSPPASARHTCAPLTTQLRSIVMLNCGGIVDLMDHLQTRLNQEDEGSGAPVV